MVGKLVANIGSALNFSQIINVVDIGALHTGAPPYDPLLKAGYANVIGFEPNPIALAELNHTKGPHETYLPYVIGDGKRHTMHFFNDGGMTSLLPPNIKVLELYNIFANCSKVRLTEEVETLRLDDIPETVSLDYLKIDVQGAELMIFQNATERLKNAVIIHTEVEFHPLYVNQPLFSDVDQYLRKHGFVLHSFNPLVTNAIAPLAMSDNPFRGFGHVLYADAVFIRDIIDLDPLSADQLLKLAVILHDCYRSYDVALRLLIECDRRINTNYSKLYYQTLAGSPL